MQYPSLTMYLFDLDGTLIASYMDRADKAFETVELLPNVASVWQHLRQITGNNMAIITNQAGVAFGYVSETDVQNKLCKVGALLGYGWVEIHDGNAEPITLDTEAKNVGGVLAIYVCYNDSRSQNSKYQDSNRRKPSGTMITEAFKREKYAEYCLMVGDRAEDLAAANNAGVDFQWSKDFFV